MAVLTEKTNYKSGDTVTAEIINDAVETALVAHEAATEAQKLSSNADKKSTQATVDSSAAKANAEQAKSEAREALEKANDVSAKAERGDFNGANGVVIPTNGIFGLQIVDGNLIVYYEDGAAAPNLHIEANGNLIFEY